MIWPFNREAKRKAQREARKSLLKQALVGYPLYDPPHKVEERRLPLEKARENFDYFMRVRKQRLTDFQTWMQEKFNVALTLDRNGVIDGSNILFKIIFL